MANCNDYEHHDKHGDLRRHLEHDHGWALFGDWPLRELLKRHQAMMIVKELLDGQHD